MLLLARSLRAFAVISSVSIAALSVNGGDFFSRAEAQTQSVTQNGKVYTYRTATYSGTAINNYSDYTFNRENASLTSGQWFEGSMSVRYLPGTTFIPGQRFPIDSGTLSVVNPDGSIQFQQSLRGLSATYYTNLQNCGQTTNLFELAVGVVYNRNDSVNTGAFLDFNFNYNVLLPGDTGVYTSWNQNSTAYRLTSGCDSLYANTLVPRAVPIAYAFTTTTLISVQAVQATAQTRVTQSRFKKFMTSVRRFFGAGDEDDGLVAFAPWIDPIGSWARQSDSNGQIPFSTNSGGFSIGIDGDYNKDVFLGGAFTYIRSNTSVDAVLPTSLQSDTYNVTLYGRYSFASSWGLTLMAGYGNVQSKSKRAIDFYNTGFATADMSADVFNGKVGIERDFGVMNNLVITPSISLAGYYLNNSGFTEQGDPNGAIVLGKATNTVTADANLRAMYKINDVFGVMANVGASYDIVQGSVTVSAAPIYSPTNFINIASEQLVPWAFNAGAGLVVNATKQVTLGAQYGVQLRPGYQNNAGSLSLRVAF